MAIESHREKDSTSRLGFRVRVSGQKVQVYDGVCNGVYDGVDDGAYNTTQCILDVYYLLEYDVHIGGYIIFEPHSQRRLCQRHVPCVPWAREYKKQVGRGACWPLPCLVNIGDGASCRLWLPLEGPGMSCGVPTRYLSSFRGHKNAPTRRKPLVCTFLQSCPMLVSIMCPMERFWSYLHPAVTQS